MDALMLSCQHRTVSLYFLVVPHKVLIPLTEDVAVQADRGCDVFLVMYPWNFDRIVIQFRKDILAPFWMDCKHFGELFTSHIQ